MALLDRKIFAIHEHCETNCRATPLPSSSFSSESPATVIREIQELSSCACLDALELSELLKDLRDFLVPVARGQVLHEEVALAAYFGCMRQYQMYFTVSKLSKFGGSL